jgi:signal peptidase II
MENKASKFKIYILDVLFLAFLFSIDRTIKHFIVDKLKDHPDFSVIPGILDLHYLENTGAAFGILKNQRAFFLMVTIIMLIAIIFLIWSFPPKKKYIAAHLFLIFISSGAIGNMTDRILNGFVVDYIYLSFINFPVFNVADIYVTIGTIGIAILLIFFYKEDDLNFLRFKEKKIRELH